MGGVNSGPAAEAAPHVKLGRVPKNTRLIEAMAQHKNAKPKPKGWLMAVVDSIYKEGVYVPPLVSLTIITLHAKGLPA